MAVGNSTVTTASSECLPREPRKKVTLTNLGSGAVFFNMDGGVAELNKGTVLGSGISLIIETGGEESTLSQQINFISETGGELIAWEVLD